eukprot:9270994-Pyramimonas_sp.AAC.1
MPLWIASPARAFSTRATTWGPPGSVASRGPGGAARPRQRQPYSRSCLRTVRRVFRRRRRSPRPRNPAGANLRGSQMEGLCPR